MKIDSLQALPGLVGCNPAPWRRLMLKIITAALVALAAASPALAFMSLRSCNLINTMNGVKYVGTYCDVRGDCIKMLFDSYCPPML